MALSVIAMRDIAAGEQLTISYIDASIRDVEHRARLLNNYGFTCGCGRCVSERDSMEKGTGKGKRGTSRK